MLWEAKDSSINNADRNMDGDLRCAYAVATCCDSDAFVNEEQINAVEALGYERRW